MAQAGYCFVSEARENDDRPRDYLYLVSEAIEAGKRYQTLDQVSLSSHHLRAYFQREGFCPRDRYADLYDERAPRLAITYEWTLSFRQIRSYLQPANIRKTHSSNFAGANFENNLLLQFLYKNSCGALVRFQQT